MIRSFKLAPTAVPDLWDYLSDGVEVEADAELSARSDYYVQVHGEAWGRGAERLGLETMTREQFELLAEGRDLDGARLIQTQHGKHVPGYDINVSPPKSVSIELIVASPERRQQLLAAHQRATRAAFDYIQDNAQVIHNRAKAKEHGTKKWREPAQLIAYVATHWTARPSEATERRGSPPDPQLHTHLWVMNLAFDDNGKARGVDHRGIARVEKGAEAAYQLRLAHELQQLDYELDWTTDRRGRRTFELAGRWQGDHHDGVPIFVLTHRVDDGDTPPGQARFVTDVEACAREARAAAGESAVMVHGAGAAQALLRAGLMDEMEIHLVHVLLGDGRRLFDRLGGDRIELDLVRRLDDRDVTHLRYRVRRPDEAA